MYDIVAQRLRPWSASSDSPPSASSGSDSDDPDSMTRRRTLATPAATAAMGTTAAARRHRADPHVVRAAAPHCSGLVPQSLVPQLGSTGVVSRNAGNETSIAGTLGHGTKIRYNYLGSGRTQSVQ